MGEEREPLEHGEDQEEFGELLRFTLAGFAGGLLLGGLLDSFSLQRSGWGQWAVRTLAGEGESLLEGAYAIKRRLQERAGSMAEAYGWGKLFGMGAPWLIDGGSRLLGLDVYAVEGFYIAYFYALSDQIGASVSGLLFLRSREGSWSRGLARYLRHPVMLTSLAVILLVPVGLLVARLLGFSPTSQLRTAGETVAANLCWIPPLVGWLRERRRRQERPGGSDETPRPRPAASPSRVQLEPPVDRPVSAPAGWTAKPPAPEAALTGLVEGARQRLPAGYVDFLRRSNGGTGRLDADLPWLILWPAEEVLALNHSHEVPEMYPGVFAIGSNGSELMIALDARRGPPWPVVSLPFVGLLDEAVVLAEDFGAFLGMLEG
jgi:hypothetical protein